MRTKQIFDANAKARIARSEHAKHGQIRPKSFASIVQKIVDRDAAKKQLERKVLKGEGDRGKG